MAYISQEAPGDLVFFLHMALVYLNKYETGLSLPRIVFFIFEMGRFRPQGAVNGPSCNKVSEGVDFFRQVTQTLGTVLKN